MRSKMRRYARVAFLVAAAGLAAAGSTARAAELLVDAPADCADPAALAEEVGTLIGRPLAEVPDVDFRLRIAEGPSGKWRLRLDMVEHRAAGDSAPAVRGTRELEGTSCAELARAAAVAVSVSVRALQAEPPAEAPPVVAQPRTPAPTPEPVRAVPTAVAAPPPPAHPWRPSVALALAVDTGALPSASPGIELEGDLQRGPLRLTLLGTWFASQDMVGP